MRLSPDQIELRDTLRSFLTEHIPSQYLRARLENRTRHDSALVSTLDALGLDEGFSGPDALFSSSELGVVAHEAGRALLPEPVVERLLATRIFPTLASAAGKKLLEALSVRESRFLLALRGGSRLQFDVATKRVTGVVEWAYGDDNPGYLLAFAEGASADSRLVLVELTQAAARVVPCSSLDLTQAVTTVELTAAAAEAFATVDTELFDALCEATKACELAGVSERAIEMTVQHVKTREQFGVPVGGFQAIQQQLADAFAKSQALGALARFAAWAATKSPEQRLLTARSAAVYAAEVAPAVCETAIQCHGGIGFTWEYDLHLYLRRAKLIQTALAPSLARVGELLAAVRS